MGLLLPGQQSSIVDRVRQGDPVAGWRGDQTMDVYDYGTTVEVWHFDNRGDRRCAVTVSKLEAGWEHTLLKKLRDGDWQNPDSWSRIDRANNQLERQRAARQAEMAGDSAERLLWAARRDMGQHFGGLRRTIYPVS